jgi:hypothetical protein
MLPPYLPRKFQLAAERMLVEAQRKLDEKKLESLMME